MWLSVSAESPVPIYEQIVDRVVFAVAAGDVEPGTLLPSVRELATELLVHHNTVSKAYQELERRGMVAPRRGLGVEVTAEAPRLCREQRREVIREQLRRALHEAFASQLPPQEIRKIVEEEFRRAKAVQANGEGA
jgi:GntR family transcriptional regulator